MLYLQDPCHPLELVRGLCRNFCGCRLAGAQWRGLRAAGSGEETPALAAVSAAGPHRGRHQATPDTRHAAQPPAQGA